MLLNFILEITLLKANVYWIIFSPNMMKSAVCFQESTLKGIQGNTLFVTLIDHLPIIKQIPQFVIKWKLFLEKEREINKCLVLYRKITLPFCSTLALITIPQPCRLAGTIEQTGGYNFSLEGKNKKQNSILSNQVNNSTISTSGYTRSHFLWKREEH